MDWGGGFHSSVCVYIQLSQHHLLKWPSFPPQSALLSRWFYHPWADPLLDFQLCDLINTFPHCLHSFEFCIILWSQKPSGWNRCCQEVAPGRSEVDASSVDGLWNNPCLVLEIFLSVLFQWIWALLLTPKEPIQSNSGQPATYPGEEATKPDQRSECSLAGTLARNIRRRCCLLL